MTKQPSDGQTPAGSGTVVAITADYGKWEQVRAVVSKVDLAFPEGHSSTAAEAGSCGQGEKSTSDPGVPVMIVDPCGAVFGLYSSSETWRLEFWTKNQAVLESIRFRGCLMRQFEEECKQQAINGQDVDDDLPLLSSTEHIRTEAKKLLTDLTESPVPELADLCADRGQGGE